MVVVVGIIVAAVVIFVVVVPLVSFFDLLVRARNWNNTTDNVFFIRHGVGAVECSYVYEIRRFGIIFFECG